MFQQSVEFPTRGMNTLDVLLYQNCTVFSTRDDDFDTMFDCSDHSFVRSNLELKVLEVSLKKGKFDSYTSGDYNAILVSVDENSF